MGLLIHTFTFDRNTFRRTTSQSADSVAEHIEKVKQGVVLDKTASNIVGALASYMGIFEKQDGKFVPTQLSAVFLKLYIANKADSWRWLVARSLWRFVVPNGTACKVNAPAKDEGITFAFFFSLTQLLTHLSALSGNQRYLYFEEFCKLFQDDANWKVSGMELFSLIIKARGEGKSGFGSERSFLEDLENKSDTERSEFDIPRDNFNGLFLKAFSQTGFFDFKDGANGKKVAVALNCDLDPVLQRRLRFILDTPPIWNGANWSSYMDVQATDMPQEVTSEPITDVPEVPLNVSQLKDLIPAVKESMETANLMVSTEQLLRFASSLQSKRFLIFTGLAGSGKTKLAQAFARWITPTSLSANVFAPGSIIPSERTKYYVNKSSQDSVEFWNAEDEAQATKVALPRELINEWAHYIKANSLTEATTARDIREGVKTTSKFSDQLHSFETHLKAAAFALINAKAEDITGACCALIPVGADWTGSENIIGFPDGLRPPTLGRDGQVTKGAYLTKPALDLIIHAQAHNDIPHFLILDEMNLSHVERYFSEILSMIESHDSITLYCDEKDWNGKPTNTRGLEPVLTLPNNLFIIGTVNVDETTYMFSPKVLDRAGVIEFRVTDLEMNTFLNDPKSPNLASLDGKGIGYGPTFVSESNNHEIAIPVEIKDRFDAEMSLYFGILREHGTEFGYRVAHEAARFLHSYKLLGDSKCWQESDGDSISGGWVAKDSRGCDWFDHAFDAIIVQKFLPKLHGSKIKLGPLLKKLFTASLESHSDASRKPDILVANLNDRKLTAQLIEPLKEFPKDARYPISAEKIYRMWRQLGENGFTSFPEN